MSLPAVEGVVPENLPDKDKVYFNDYATLVQQQGMLQDSVRTSIYQFAVLENKSDFTGQTVLDVGAGTGILSFFAARAGAKRVYAVEASGMARHAETLAKANGLADTIHVLNERVEDVKVDEGRVDVLISEPLGIALVNERMLESYVYARDHLLKPGGKMFPDHSVMYAAPFSDDALYSEQLAKANFWCQTNFYGVDLTSLREAAQSFYFSQPVVGPVSPHTLLSLPVAKNFDFNTITADELVRFDLPLAFTTSNVCQLHGVAVWFDCRFPGSQQQLMLSTSPHDPLTHWYQVRIMLRAPIAVGAGHQIVGTCKFEANEARGYNIKLSLTNANTGMSCDNTVVSQCALHHFQYTSQQSAAYVAPAMPMAGAPTQPQAPYAAPPAPSDDPGVECASP